MINLHKKKTGTYKKVTRNIGEARMWKCDDCGNNNELVTWSYEDIAYRGNPVCPSCDSDMILIPKV